MKPTEMSSGEEQLITWEGDSPVNFILKQGEFLYLEYNLLVCTTTDVVQSWICLLYGVAMTTSGDILYSVNSWAETNKPKG